MDDFLISLKTKRKDLENELSKNQTFKLLEGVKSMIALYENGSSEIQQEVSNSPVEVPPEYSNELTWRERILFVIKKLQSATIQEINTELKRLGAKEDEKFLYKRVATVLSLLKNKKELGARKVGKKNKYFIK